MDAVLDILILSDLLELYIPHTPESDGEIDLV